MSTIQKVDLTKEYRGEYPLTVLLGLLSLPRSTWYYHTGEKRSYTDKYSHLREPLEQIAREHSAYGYRRTASELSDMLGEPINHKVVQRLHKCWNLRIMRSTTSPKPSGVREVILEAGELCNLAARVEDPEPFEILYTDFTELHCSCGKYYLIPLVDHRSKYCPGWAVGKNANTDLALMAWESARDGLDALDVPLENLIVHHDRDSVFTSYAWTSRLLLEDGVRVSYALDGAKSNTAMESFNGRFKTENRSLISEAKTFEELFEIVNDRMRYYNEERRHSTLGNQAPLVWLKNWRR
ncbi:MAG: IS3 family transposase [Candidatus Aegiribacteria sp.]